MSWPLLARQLRMSWYMFFQLLPGISERALPRLIPLLWEAWSPGYAAEDDVQHVLAALADRRHRTAALRYYRALLLPWNRRAAYAEQRPWLLRAPRAPLLYLHGERDGCMQAAVARRGAELLPAGSRFELMAGVGHFLQLEDPDGVGERIAAFIAGRLNAMFSRVTESVITWSYDRGTAPPLPRSLREGPDGSGPSRGTFSL